MVLTIDSVTDEGSSTDEARILSEAGAHDWYVLEGSIALRRMTAWISSISRSKAYATTPPMMTRSGLKRWIKLVNPAPR